MFSCWSYLSSRETAGSWGLSDTKMWAERQCHHVHVTQFVLIHRRRQYFNIFVFDWPGISEYSSSLWFFCMHLPKYIKILRGSKFKGRHPPPPKFIHVRDLRAFGSSWKTLSYVQRWMQEKTNIEKPFFLKILELLKYKNVCFRLLIKILKKISRYN